MYYSININLTVEEFKKLSDKEYRRKLLISKIAYKKLKLMQEALFPCLNLSPLNPSKRSSCRNLPIKMLLKLR
jgi:hypothetical protein